MAEINTKILGTYKGKTGEVKIENSKQANFPYNITIETAVGMYTCEYEDVAILNGNMLTTKSKIRIKLASDGKSLEVLDNCDSCCGMRGTIIGIFKRK